MAVKEIGSCFLLNFSSTLLLYSSLKERGEVAEDGGAERERNSSSFPRISSGGLSRSTGGDLRRCALISPKIEGGGSLVVTESSDSEFRIGGGSGGVEEEKNRKEEKFGFRVLRLNRMGMEAMRSEFLRSVVSPIHCICFTFKDLWDRFNGLGYIGP